MPFQQIRKMDLPEFKIEGLNLQSHYGFFSSVNDDVNWVNPVVLLVYWDDSHSVSLYVQPDLDASAIGGVKGSVEEAFAKAQTTP